MRFYSLALVAGSAGAALLVSLAQPEPPATAEERGDTLQPRVLLQALGVEVGPPRRGG